MIVKYQPLNNIYKYRQYTINVKINCAKMNNTTCMVCFTTNGYMVDILDTNLQSTYEKLTDLNVCDEMHYLCFICKRKLQQCYEMQQCYQWQQFANNENQICINNINYEYEIKIKQEVDDDITFEQKDFDDAQEIYIKKEYNFSGNLSLQCSNTNHSEIGSETEQAPFRKLNTKVVILKYEGDDHIIKYSNNVCQHICDNESISNNPNIKSSKFINQQLMKCKICEIRRDCQSYSCDTCKKTFSKKDFLIMHIKSHTDDKPFSCEVCSKTFSERRKLTRHKRTHRDNKPCYCNVCNKPFSRSSTLTVHKRTHTGDKPYSCLICNKTFTSRSHLTTHKRTHTGDKPFSCDVCNKTFSVKNYLTAHLRIHMTDKPYCCDVCNKTFSQNSTLIKHKRIHTGDKPFSCDVCNKTFSRSCSLLIHKRTHTGDKPYNCNICNKKFSRSGILMIHKKTHVSEIPYSWV